MAGQFSGVVKRTVDIFPWSETLATSSMHKMQKGQVQLRHTGRKREGRRGRMKSRVLFGRPHLPSALLGFKKPSLKRNSFQTAYRRMQENTSTVFLGIDIES